MSQEGTRTQAAAALRSAARGAGEAGLRLEVLDGPMAGRSLALGDEETVGRGASASLALPDPAASRRHLVLRLASGAVTAEDLGSKNGSRLNRRRLGRVRRLRPGDVLTVGSTRLRLQGLDPAPAEGTCRQRPRPSPSAPLLGGAALALLAAAAALLVRG